MSGKRTSPPLTLSLALAASAGFVAVVGVIAANPKGAEPSQVVLQVPVSVPATARPVDATPPSATPVVPYVVPPAVNATSPAASADAVRGPVPQPAAEPANLPAPSPLTPTVVLEATPTTATDTSGRTGERVQPTQVEVIDATSRAS